MTAVLLLGYAAGLLLVLPPRLHGRAWTRRSPPLAIALWLAACASALVAVAVAAATLIVPMLGHALHALVEACGLALGHTSRTVVSRLSDLVGLVVLVGIATRLLHAAARVVVPVRQQRRRHRAALRLLARHEPGLGVLVLEHPCPTAFCLPGRGGRIVLSRGALDLLDPEQVTAVVAHERAHLRGRHHWIGATAAILARAFPWAPLFSAARIELAELVEMAADDAASRHAAPDCVARALLGLAQPRTPTAALGMTGPSTAERVGRLLAPRRPLGPLRTSLGSGLVAALLLVPVASPTVPALLTGSHCPPLTSPGTVR